MWYKYKVKILEQMIYMHMKSRKILHWMGKKKLFNWNITEKSTFFLKKIKQISYKSSRDMQTYEKHKHTNKIQKKNTWKYMKTNKISLKHRQFCTFAQESI